MCALTPWRTFFNASAVLDCTIFLSTKQLSEHLKKWRNKAYTRNSFHQQSWHVPDSVLMGSLCCWLLVFWVGFYRASKDERAFEMTQKDLQSRRTECLTWAGKWLYVTKCYLVLVRCILRPSRSTIWGRIRDERPQNLARTTWTITHWSRVIMRPRD